MKIYRFYSDPGHGWVAVKLSELVKLGIADKISPFSYMRGQTAYLEEDSDYSTWIEAYRREHGTEPNIRETYHERTPIRSYDRFSI